MWLGRPTHAKAGVGLVQLVVVGARVSEPRSRETEIRPAAASPMTRAAANGVAGRAVEPGFKNHPVARSDVQNLHRLAAIGTSEMQRGHCLTGGGGGFFMNVPSSFTMR